MEETSYLGLRWNNHSAMFGRLLNVLREQELYTDVSLACDGKIYPAHKFVLSTCSDFFKEMFSSSSCKHPVIYLKDVSTTDIQFLLDFMYKGETRVSQLQLGSLLRAAEGLKIKGLAVPDDLLVSPEKPPPPFAPHQPLHTPDKPPPPFDSHQPLHTPGKDTTAPFSTTTSSAQRKRKKLTESKYGSSKRPAMEAALTSSRLDHDGTDSLPGPVLNGNIQEDDVVKGHHPQDLSSELNKDPRPESPHTDHLPATKDDPSSPEDDPMPEPASPPGTNSPDGCSDIQQHSSSDPDSEPDECPTDSAATPAGRGPDSSLVDRSEIKENIDGNFSASHIHKTTNGANGPFIKEENDDGLSGGGGGGESNPLRSVDRGQTAAFMVALQNMDFASLIKSEIDAASNGPLESSSVPSPHPDQPLNFSRRKKTSTRRDAAGGAEGGQKKPFVCVVCGHAFTRRDNLTNHIMTHTGERPFMCSYCFKCFNRKDYLRQHERIHTGEKPYACGVCGRAFTRKEGLTDHVRCHSDLKEFECDVCGKSFKQKCGLRFHKRNYKH